MLGTETGPAHAPGGVHTTDEEYAVLVAAAGRAGLARGAYAAQAALAAAANGTLAGVQGSLRQALIELMRAAGLVRGLVQGPRRVPGRRASYGLRSTAPADRTAARRPFRAESGKAARRGLDEAPRITLRRRVTTATASANSQDEFFARLDTPAPSTRSSPVAWAARPGWPPPWWRCSRTPFSRSDCTGRSGRTRRPRPPRTSGPRGRGGHGRSARRRSSPCSACPRRHHREVLGILLSPTKSVIVAETSWRADPPGRRHPSLATLLPSALGADRFGTFGC